MNDAIQTWITNPEEHARHWAVIQDMVDHTIDLMLNYRQSGHPGGSRSKVPALLALTLSGAMRFDIRSPEKRLADRFILSAGHTVPAIYALLAVYNEAMRLRHEESGDRRFQVKGGESFVLTWEDLLGFRHNGGLSGHAEMGGKTLFLKFNTGPSGHGSSAALGEALALKRAGAAAVRVFALEGEGGLTPGVNHEVKNAAWGYGLDNLYFLVDWNDFGIDPQRTSSVVPGNPETWFDAYDWRVRGVVEGDDPVSLSKQLIALTTEIDPDQRPGALWFRTRKGRGYNKYDYASHGSPHSPVNSPAFWETVKPLEERYGITFAGQDGPAPNDRKALREQFQENLRRLFSLLRSEQETMRYLADRLVEIGESVPSNLEPLKVATTGRNPWKDPRFFDAKSYPEELWAQPGDKKPNRAGLGRWGSYVNALARKEYGRPLFLALSADLAHSTNMAGFAEDFSPDLPGFGTYNRHSNPEGVLLPAVITEFANAGLAAGAASVNLSRNPFSEWDGFCAACSTYGSFSYLKYGMMRLFSQLAQDCELKTGKVLWVAGHSGPETAEDSRTHFGIFAPVVTQLFPRDQILNLYPWEYNEVPVLLAEAFKSDVPIIALHLTRPAIPIPNRQVLRLPSHFEAAKGAYVLRDFAPDQPKGGTLFVQGTMTTHNLLSILPELVARRLNVKVIAAISPELYRRQSPQYKQSVCSWNEFMDSTFITSGARIGMQDWTASRISLEYAMSADFDNRWRTGGSIEDVYREAHLSPEHLLQGITHFVTHRKTRLARLRVED